MKRYNDNINTDKYFLKNLPFHMTENTALRKIHNDERRQEFLTI